MSESLTHSFPRSFLVVALSASEVGFADALWLCPERALRRLFASVSLLAPGALSPPLAPCLSLTVSVIGAHFAFAEGRLPLVLGPVGTLGGVAVSPPISPYTGPGWSPPFLPGAFSATVGVFCLLCGIPPVFHGDHLVSFTDSCVSIARHPRMGLFLGHLHGV